MSNRSHADTSHRGGRGVATSVPEAGPKFGRGLAFALLAGTAGCAASPQYPIHMGERAGDGTIMSAQPRYAVSAQDAAQNAADRQSQAGYPAYGAPPMSDAPPPRAEAPDAPVAPPPSAPADDMADDAPKPPSQSAGAVDSADLPPPGAAPYGPASAGADAPVPPADPAASPHDISYDYGGGQVVFGMDWVVTPQVELAAYRHRRHAVAASQSDTAADSSASGDAATSRSHRRHHGEPAASDEAASTPAHAAADTPYQTVVKPGESLAEVAERVHSSRAALTELNDLKHPRHVKAGTVLKIPYRYSYEVQKGDTLYTIAHRFSQDPAEIAKLNGLKTAPTLQPGQTVQLPPDAADQGKRDHASASGPAPVAAPAKLADAALRKIERHGRRSRGTAELNTAEAALPPQEIRHARRRGGAYAEAGSAPSASEQGTTASTAAPASPPAAPTVSVEPSRPAVATAAPSSVSRPYAPPVSAPRPYASAPAIAATTSGSTLGATPTGSRPLAPASVAAASAASGGTATYRPSAAAPSTYVAPGYVARAQTQQYASVTPPRHTPGYPATGASPATPYTPSLGRERPSAPALSGGAATAADIASAGRGRFIWPLRGPVVSGFGAKGTGEYNNGMDISAQPGTGVRAAASGDVVYAGSSIPGYGNMVLIKHSGGWVTAYAHLNRIEVRMHDTVSQGDEIGQAGQTGVVDRPELYFEVRYAASAADRPRPVDPALVLPAGGG